MHDIQARVEWYNQKLNQALNTLQNVANDKASSTQEVDHEILKIKRLLKHMQKEAKPYPDMKPAVDGLAKVFRETITNVKTYWDAAQASSTSQHQSQRP